MIATERFSHTPHQEQHFHIADATPHIHVEPLGHDHHEEHSVGCSCGGHEGHSHEVLFSESLEKIWGTRFDTVLQASFLLTTKGAIYAPEKRVGIESAIRKLEFSPDPRSQTDAEKQMNQAFDSLIQKSPILQKITQAPLETIATTLLNLRSVRFTPEDQQSLEEKMLAASSEEHAHVHANEDTLTYDIHLGENHHSFTYSEVLQIIALHMAQEIKGEGEEAPQAKAIHTLAHALAEAGVTLANKRSLDNPYVKEHPYALREGQTLQDFELALRNHNMETFQLENLHELGGIHGAIRMNEQGQLVEDACPDHAQEVDQQLEQLQQETQQEFQQTVNKQTPMEQQEIREPMERLDGRRYPAGAPAQREQRSILDTASRSATSSLSTPSVSTAVPQPQPQASTERRPRRTTMPSIPRSTQRRQTPSFEDTLSRPVHPPSIVTSRRKGSQSSERGTSNAVVRESAPVYQNQSIQLGAELTVPQRETTPPRYVQSDLSIPSNVIPFPTLLKRDVPSAVRQDALPIKSLRSSEEAPIIVVNRNTNRDANLATLSPLREIEEMAQIVEQAMAETPEDHKPVITSASIETDLKNVVVSPTEMSSFSSDRALPSAPKPERPPQDPKRTLDNTTRTVSRRAAIREIVQYVVIGTTLEQALKATENQTTAIQEQKEEHVAATQAVGVQKSDQTTARGEEAAVAGGGNAPAVSRTTERETKQESTEKEYTVKTATGISLHAKQSGITAPVYQGRSANTENIETDEIEQTASDKGTNEQVHKVQVAGNNVQLNTPQRTQSNTTTASVTKSQGATLERQVADPSNIPQDDPVLQRITIDSILRGIGNASLNQFNPAA